MDDWQYVNDDPCADPSALALMLLSEFARNSGMKVMLAGEGSDELFGGYNAYSRFVTLNALRSVPVSSRSQLHCEIDSRQKTEIIFSLKGHGTILGRGI